MTWEPILLQTSLFMYLIAFSGFYLDIKGRILMFKSKEEKKVEESGSVTELELKTGPEPEEGGDEGIVEGEPPMPELADFQWHDENVQETFAKMETVTRSQKKLDQRDLVNSLTSVPVVDSDPVISPLSENGSSVWERSPGEIGKGCEVPNIAYGKSELPVKAWLSTETLDVSYVLEAFDITITGALSGSDIKPALVGVTKSQLADSVDSLRMKKTGKSFVLALELSSEDMLFKEIGSCVCKALDQKIQKLSNTHKKG